MSDSPKDYSLTIWFVVLFFFLAFAISKCSDSLAIERGYEQVVEDGHVVWKKKEP